jgi:ribosome-associated toxin RatA of RatAB toxin-antitoxin module
MGRSRSTDAARPVARRPLLAGLLAVGVAACAGGGGQGGHVAPRSPAPRPDLPPGEGPVHPTAAPGGGSGADAPGGGSGADTAAGMDRGGIVSMDRGGIVSVAVPVGDTGFARGRSTAIVRAPLDRVRAAVLEFARYPEFMPHYEACRVLGRTPNGGRDVYMEVSALHGAVKMWARLEIPKPILIEGVETYPSRFIDGNVEELQAIWRMEKIDVEQTRLSLEVFLRPKLPLPKGLINSENLEGSASAVAAMRARIERGGGSARR